MFFFASALKTCIIYSQCFDCSANLHELSQDSLSVVLTTFYSTVIVATASESCMQPDLIVESILLNSYTYIHMYK